RTTPPPPSTLFPYTTLFRSQRRRRLELFPHPDQPRGRDRHPGDRVGAPARSTGEKAGARIIRTGGATATLAFRQAWHAARTILRSEEHTSELQSRSDLVCRL